MGPIPLFPKTSVSVNVGLDSTESIARALPIRVQTALARVEELICYMVANVNVYALKASLANTAAYMTHAFKPHARMAVLALN